MMQQPQLLSPRRRRRLLLLLLLLRYKRRRRENEEVRKLVKQHRELALPGVEGLLPSDWSKAAIPQSRSCPTTFFLLIAAAAVRSMS
jgi:hypothetical protein